MSSRYKIRDNAYPYFITSTVVGWVDALSRPLYKDILIQSILFCIQNKGLRVHAWVFMSNHIHMIISADSDKSNISGIIRDFKKYTSVSVTKAIEDNPQESRRDWMMNMFAFTGRNNGLNKNMQFWQNDYHPIELNSSEKIEQRLNYIPENPVRAGLVWTPPDYKYSSAIDYYTNQKGLIPVDLLL